ncbi:MAG TPA: sulfatase [Candidatus Krumholzibacteria bacterium]|nr:sulfatase [Candidatus Krumholzibacteria bacterium]
MSRGLRAVVAVAIACVFSAGGCAREKRPPNLVLITVDTLRPDHLGYGGSQRPTSPRLDRLAQEGVVFDHAVSASGWTLPSVATIFTGRYPKDHGATDFHWSLDPSLPTLAGILRRSGYDTHGFVSHIMLTPTYGMGDGFAHFDFSVLNVGHPHEISTSTQLTELALKGLRNVKEPYFLWVHYFDPHFEYLEHGQFPFGTSEEQRYDSEIAFTDYYIDNLLKVVDRGNTIVVFTSDHGEEFGEHDGQYHYTLHGEVMRVPLIVKAPGLAPRVESAPVEQIDLLPTILSLLGVAAPEGLPGRDLFGAAPAPAGAPLFMERDRPPQWRQRGVQRGGHKLIVIEEADTSLVPPTSRNEEIPVTNVHPGIYLYDLARDPGERDNLFSRDDPVSLELLGLVATHFATAAARPQPVAVDAELLEKLKSLGYVH